MVDIAQMVGGGRGSTGTTGAAGTNAPTIVIYNGIYSGLPAPQAGFLAIVTDVGLAGSLWIASVTDWKPLHQITLFDANTASVITGNTTLHSVYTLSLPANLVRAASAIEVEIFGSCTGSVNSKEITATLKLVSGGTNYNFLDIVTTTISDTSFQAKGVCIPRSSGAQLGREWSLGAPGGWNYTNANVIGSIDTTQSTNIIIKAQLGNAADSITLEAVKVKLIP